MQNDLLLLTQDFLKLLRPKSKGIAIPTANVEIIAEKKIETAAVAVSTLKIPQIAPKPIEKKGSDRERLAPPKNKELTLHDLKEWFEKRFKTPAITPLNDQRALTARQRFIDGTQKAAIALLVPKNVADASLYKNIQMAVNNYITPCTFVLIEQFSKASADTVRLLLTDRAWLTSFKEQILHDATTQSDTLFSIPIFYLEPLEQIKTPEGKQRLWQALQQLPRL